MQFDTMLRVKELSDLRTPMHFLNIPSDLRTLTAFFKHPLGTYLTHWGQVTHICLGNLTIIGPDNGLSPGRRQVIIWTNAGLLLIGPFGTNFSEILFGIQTFSFKKMHFKMSSAKWRPFCLRLNVLILGKCSSYSLNNFVIMNQFCQRRTLG